MDLSRMTYLLASLDVTENLTYNPSTTITPPQAYSTESWTYYRTKWILELEKALVLIRVNYLLLFRLSPKMLVPPDHPPDQISPGSGQLVRSFFGTWPVFQIIQVRWLENDIKSNHQAIYWSILFNLIYISGTDETRDLELMDWNCSSPNLLRRTSDIYPVNLTFLFYTPGIGPAVSKINYHTHTPPEIHRATNLFF